MAKRGVVDRVAEVVIRVGGAGGAESTAGPGDARRAAAVVCLWRRGGL